MSTNVITGMTPGKLDSSTDVTIVNPSNGEVLTFNSTSGQWENAAPTGGTSASIGFDAVFLLMGA